MGCGVARPYGYRAAPVRRLTDRQRGICEELADRLTDELEENDGESWKDVLNVVMNDMWDALAYSEPEDAAE